jgi:hypothetical protein
MRIKTVAALVALMAVLALANAPSANAGEPPWGPVYADNSAHSYFYDDDLTTREHNGMEYARKTSLDAATQMSTSVNSSYNVQVDVWVYNTYHPSGDQVHWYAWTTCNRMVSGSSTKCDQHTVIFNEKLPHPDYWALACHEQGHTIGFGEGTGQNSNYSSSGRSCMRGDPDVHQYSATDKSKINAHY